MEKINVFQISIRFYLLGLFFVLSNTLLLISCADKSGEYPVDSDRVSLLVDVGGIDDLVMDVPAVKMKGSEGERSNSIKADAAIKSLSGSVFFQALSMEQNLSTGTLKPRTVATQQTVGLMRGNSMRQVMQQGMTYRILLYHKASGAFYKSYVAIAGTKLVIDLVKNEEFNWIAYSYNTSNDIPMPENTSSPTINTPSNSELLYASGTVSASKQNVPLIINFAHKLAKITVSVDVTEMYADIVELKGSFAKSDYVHHGMFNLRTGATSDLLSSTISEIDFRQTDANSGSRRIASYYTADPNKLSSIDVKISSLTVKYVNGEVEQVVEAPVSSSFGPYRPKIGKETIASLKLWKLMRSKKIVHVSRNDGHGYAAGEKASRNLLGNFRNFGSSVNSLVKVKPFTHVVLNKHGELLNELRAAVKPDIVIIGVYYDLSSAEIVALVNYTRSGGVVLLMTDKAGGSDQYNAHVDYLRSALGAGGIQRNDGDSGGSVYLLGNHNDEILNGPFGNIRGRAWGEDASTTSCLVGLPSSDITIYSGASPVNSSKSYEGVTMFKHNTLNLFWIGDGGFLSNTLERGERSSNSAYPFATNSNDFPVVKLYGSSGNGHSSGSLQIYNSIIFANVMNWAIVRAEFFGINKRS